MSGVSGTATQTPVEEASVSLKEWDRVSARLRVRIGLDTYTHFFASARCEGETTPGAVVVSFANNFLTHWANAHYIDIVQTMWNEERGGPVKVIFRDRQKQMAAKPAKVPSKPKISPAPALEPVTLADVSIGTNEPSPLTIAKEVESAEENTTAVDDSGSDDELLSDDPGLITIEDCQRYVSTKYDVPMARLKSAERKRPVTHPRQVAMYLAKILTPHSLPKIGRKFGGRDHTTVLHAFRKIELMRSEDPAFDRKIQDHVDEITKAARRKKPTTMPPPSPDKKIESRIVRLCQDHVVEHYGINRLELLSDRRPSEVIRPRFIAMYLARNLTSLSFSEIGMHFGGRDHATVHGALTQLELELSSISDFDREVRDHFIVLSAKAADLRQVLAPEGAP